MGRRLTTEEFISRAKEVHGDKYNYSKVHYLSTDTKVCVICPEHGEFFVTPHHHLRSVGCPKCAGRLKTNEDIISQFVNVHGDKYDYSKVNYRKATSKVTIICPKHGEFKQRPSDHLSGYGCPKCRSLRLDNNTFIEKARKVHGNKYDYSKTEYKGCRNLIKIICSKHGEFLQTPFKHLQGHGCPCCNESHLERDVRGALEKNGIRYEYQCNKKRFPWLEKQSLDFYLPDYHTAIECQGKQHYESIDYFGGEEKLNYVVGLDEKKKTLCENNGINLIYYTNHKSENAIKTTDELVRIIKNE